MIYDAWNGWSYPVNKARVLGFGVFLQAVLMIEKIWKDLECSGGPLMIRTCSHNLDRSS